MSKLEEKALKAYPVIMETLIPVDDEHEEVKQDCNQFLREAYKNGYREAIDDICKWIENYTANDCYINCKILATELRKTMEE